MFKEGRDWLTCAVSLAVPPMLWMGSIALKNQRLEIDASMRNQYVQQEEYRTEVKKLEGQDTETWRKLGDTNAKIDGLSLQMATGTQVLLDLKEEVKGLRK